MKKMILAATLLLFAGLTDAQELKKGNLVGTHLGVVKLAPGVTMEQFTEFYANKFRPELEKAMGWKFYPVRRIRGEKADGFAMIIVIASEAERNKYYNADGSPTELNKGVTAKLKPIQDELDKLGTMTSDVYTDWLVY